MQGIAALAPVVAAPRGLAVNGDDVGVGVDQAADPGLEAGRQLRYQCGEHVAQCIVARDPAFVAVDVLEERQMLGSPQCRLDEVVRPGDGRRQHQQQDFSEWIQYLGMLTRVAKGGEVIQQSGAGRGRHRGASFMRLPMNRTFSRAGSYFRYSSDCPGSTAWCTTPLPRAKPKPRASPSPMANPPTMAPRTSVCMSGTSAARRSCAPPTAFSCRSAPFIWWC